VKRPPRAYERNELESEFGVAFPCEKIRARFFGCDKDDSTLAQILLKDSFAGYNVSDVVQ
jgi:hypothetical protein